MCTYRSKEEIAEFSLGFQIHDKQIKYALIIVKAYLVIIISIFFCFINCNLTRGANTVSFRYKSYTVQSTHVYYM